jgi:translation elongation factor EF-4
LRSDYFRALVFDTVYHAHRGAIIFVACFGREIKAGDRVASHFTKKTYEIQEVGICRPTLKKTQKLLEKKKNTLFFNYFNSRDFNFFKSYAGQVGYLVCNIRNIKEALVGDTFHMANEKRDTIEAFPGFKVPKPMVSRCHTFNFLCFYI